MVRALVVAVLAMSGAAAGQSALFLAPESYGPEADGSVEVAFERRGVDTAAAAWPEGVEWVFVRGGGTQENRWALEAGAREGSAELPLARAAVTMIGVDLAARVEEIGGKELRAFVEARGDEASRAAAAGLAGEGAVRVRRVESAKAIVRARGAPAGASSTAVDKSGQRVEIRMLSDPTAAEVGSDVPVRAYVQGDKLASSRVVATHVASGRTAEVVTDEGGIGWWRVSEAGAWRLEMHHLRRVEGEAEAAWELHSATVVFETPEGER